MPLERADVNLWKSGEVSYLQTHSYSTELAEAGCEKRTDSSPIWFFEWTCKAVTV